MLSITVTLVIQAVNFLISWWILDRFLFRPFVAEVFKERKEKSIREGAVFSEQYALQKVQEEQKQVFIDVDKTFTESLPPIVQDASLKTISSQSFVHIQECDITTQKMVASDIVGTLVKRITHV